MRMAVFGSGYVGLVSGACFADFGHIVTCVDVDADRITNLKAGIMPIFEPGLDELVRSNVAMDRLRFTTSTTDAINDAELILIAVGTPSRQSDGHADLSHVFAAARQIARELPGDVVVVTKSTVPVGTGDEVQRIMLEERPDLHVSVASNPEFLREGAAIWDFKRPDRIVIGCEDDRARAVMAEAYRPLYINQAPMFFTSRRTAELIKYASNAFLATKITFINEIADLCEQIGANVQEVARGIGLDNRIGSKFLHAGPGYGGSCFPKDTLALVKSAQDQGVSLRVLETVVAVNEQRKRAMGRRVISAAGGDLRGKQVALLGLAFKPNTDDMREAPSLPIITALQDAGAKICAHDPKAMDHARQMGLGIAFADDAYTCAGGADVLVIATEWEAFRALDMRRILASMNTPLLVDLRNIYRPDDMRKIGFRYFGVGVQSKPEQN
ncbi:MAG: UDP-glucose/GDP-mannose dehydrogenase family protein [Hyphomicrobium sp.]|nr:UDP-glucose/GDP-mannose dehydrogenase family protein [Hyphomicrobium sp.]